MGDGVDRGIVAVLIVTAYAPPEIAAEVCEALAAIPGSRHVMLGPETTDGRREIRGRVSIAAAESALAALLPFQLGPDDVYLSRSEYIRPFPDRSSDRDRSSDGRARIELLYRARLNSDVRASYLLDMVAAGIIAGIGVVTGSAILVVGAMAISPDLLPIVAIAIGLVERQWQIVLRAAAALVVGLSVGALAAFAAVRYLVVTDRLDDDLSLAESVLGPALTSLGPGSVLVALAAGMAGVLALARVGGAVTGVAISVTTIPAAAYIGASVATRSSGTGGALAVLGVNISMMVLAGALTIGVRRWRAARG